MRTAIVLVVFFASGTFLGFSLTSLVAPTIDDWMFWLGARVFWQFGSALALAVFCLVHAKNKRSAMTVASVFVAIGLLLAINPIRDLVAGPASGRLVREMELFRGRRSIHADTVVVTPEGERIEIRSAGLAANVWQFMARRCSNGVAGAQVVVLEHLDVLLDFRCNVDGRILDATGRPRSILGPF